MIGHVSGPDMSYRLTPEKSADGSAGIRLEPGASATVAAAPMSACFVVR